MPLGLRIDLGRADPLKAVQQTQPIGADGDHGEDQCGYTGGFPQWIGIGHGALGKQICRNKNITNEYNMVESRLEMKEARDARIGPALGRRGLALGRRDQVRRVREGNFPSCNLLKIIDIGKSSREGAGI